MKLFVVISILLAKDAGGQEGVNKAPSDYASSIFTQLLQHMYIIDINLKDRVEALNPIRFKAENHAFYEMGYLMAIIIEKYRMMVEQVKRPRIYKADTLPETLMRLEEVQRLYFEIWHLCMMMHEIPPKYGERIEVFDRKKMEEEKKRLELELQKKKYDEEKQRLDEEQRQKEFAEVQSRYAMMSTGAMAAEGGASPTRRTRTKFTRSRKRKTLSQRIVTTRNVTRFWWPLEYGWDIDRPWR